MDKKLVMARVKMSTIRLSYVPRLIMIQSKNRFDGRSDDGANEMIWLTGEVDWGTERS